MGNVKLAFFDMEGTILKKAIDPQKVKVPPSVWYLLAESLGKKALTKEELTHKKKNKNQYSGYLEWMSETIEIHKKYGLTKTSFEEILNKIKFHQGVSKVFKILKKKGIKTVLITGGFKYQADKVQKILKIDHSYVACEYFWDQKGRLTHWNLLPADSKGKRDFMKSILKDYKIKACHCMFVGDGDNDIPLAKAVGLSIAFNGSEKLEKNCTHRIRQEKGKENFEEVLKFL